MDKEQLVTPTIRDLEEFFSDGPEIKLPTIKSKPVKEKVECNLAYTLGEKMVRMKMEEGWNIQIECKAKGRNFEMSYEATAYNVNDDYKMQVFNRKHGVGNTLIDLIASLFGVEEYNNLLKRVKKE
jgi:hypothetical protein